MFAPRADKTRGYPLAALAWSDARRRTRIVSGVVVYDRSPPVPSRGGLVACVACTHTHARSLRRLRVSRGVVPCVRACELRLSAVARGPFCCPLGEVHRFDTCRVADIKACARALDAATRFHGDWSRKSRRDCARFTSATRPHAEVGCGTNVGRARERMPLPPSIPQRTVILHRPRTFTSYLIKTRNFLSTKCESKFKRVPACSTQSRNRRQRMRVYIRARAPPTIMIVAIFVCNLRKLSRSEEIVPVLWVRILSLFTAHKLAFNILRVYR